MSSLIPTGLDFRQYDYLEITHDKQAVVPCFCTTALYQQTKIVVLSVNELRRSLAILEGTWGYSWYLVSTPSDRISPMETFGDAPTDATRGDGERSCSGIY